MRFRLTLLLLGFTATGALPVEAQQFRVNNASSATLRTASEFASEVLGDPWDFEERTDFVFMFSDNAHTGESGFELVPNVAEGLLSGQINNRNNGGRGHLNVNLLFEGVSGAFNSIPRTGIRYPIDANRFNRVSFRMRRGAEVGGSIDTNLIGVSWFRQLRANGGQRLASATGTWAGNPYANQSPVADQGKTTYHIYTLDLDQGYRDGDPWGGVMGGVSLRVASNAGLGGAGIDLDWARLTPRGEVAANLSWSGFNGRVTITARNDQTGDLIQIFPGAPAVETPDFPSSGTLAWDYGFLPAGTWILTAATGNQSRSVTLNVDAAPVVNITEPDASGGRDWATTTFADPWDMTNVQDVARCGQLFQIPFGVFSELGLDGVTNGEDPHVQITGLHGCPKIPAQTYHRLTFTIAHDHPELMAKDVLANGGNIMRIVWNMMDGLPSDFRVTQDLFTMDGFAQTYSMDLKTLDDANEVEPGGTLWRDANLMSILRIDINESVVQRAFRLSNVKLAADDEPNGNGFFVVKWRVADAVGSRQNPANNGADSNVNLYYDTDLDPNNGKTTIVTGLSAALGQYAWDVTPLTPGVQYYVYVEIGDNSGNFQGRYSTGPVRTPGYPANFRTDNNGNGLPDVWEQRFAVSSPSQDADGDGLTNQQEYQSGTNPLTSNVWNLSEGATGFFTQRLALANPDEAPAQVSIKYLRAGGKAPVTREYTVLPYARLTINVNDIAGFQQEDVSAVVSSISGGVVVERTMFWGDLWYGGHTGKAIQQARNEWFLAEGAANNFFSTFVLLANAEAADANVTLTFLRQGDTPFTMGVGVPANSRVTIPTNNVPELNGTSFATKITSSVPISVERSMYLNNNPDHPFEGGHESAAVAEAKTEWYVAEGQASAFFAMFVLLANPNPSPTEVTLRYLMPGRTPTTKVLTLDANSRYTVQIGNDADAPGVHDTDVSVEVKATLPIVVERAMYWPANGRWTDGHNSAGLTSTGIIWGLAEGEFGGSRAFQTYVLFANPTNQDASVRMTLLREGEGRQALSQDFVVPANQRLTKSAQDFVGMGLQSGEKFGIIVNTHNAVPIVVERAMYWNGGGEFWGGGTNETGFKLK